MPASLLEKPLEFETAARCVAANCPGWTLVSLTHRPEFHNYKARAIKGTWTVESSARPSERDAVRELIRVIPRYDITLAPPSGPRVCFVGYGRHGKDEAAFTLHGLGRFRYYGSTSWAALPEVAEKLGIPEQIAWEKRHENREFWKSYCDYLRRDDPLYLIRKVLARGNICAGIRDKVEIEAALEQNLFDAVVWVERPGFPVDPTVTFTREVATAGCTIINNGTLEDFHRKVKNWAYQRGFITVNDL